MILNYAQIRQILPHRPPMLLLDMVRSLDPGSNIVATKNVTCDEVCFAGLTGATNSRCYIYPYSLIIESFGQAASILYSVGRQMAFSSTGEVMLLGAVSRCRFDGEVSPGDTMELRARLERSLTDAAIFSGEVWVNNRRIVEIERLVLAIRPAEVLAPSSGQAHMECSRNPALPQ